MKHLRKYNEELSNDHKDIKEYIAECFIDFLDAGGKVQLFHYDGEYTIEIMIPKDEEPSVVSASKEIERIIDRNEKENETLGNALLCIERVKSMYNLYYKFSIYNSSYEIKFEI